MLGVLVLSELVFDVGLGELGDAALEAAELEDLLA